MNEIKILFDKNEEEKFNKVVNFLDNLNIDWTLKLDKEKDERGHKVRWS